MRDVEVEEVRRNKKRGRGREKMRGEKVWHVRGNE